MNKSPRIARHLDPPASDRVLSKRQTINSILLTATVIAALGLHAVIVAEPASATHTVTCSMENRLVDYGSYWRVKHARHCSSVVKQITLNIKVVGNVRYWIEDDKQCSDTAHCTWWSGNIPKNLGNTRIYTWGADNWRSHWYSVMPAWTGWWQTFYV